MQPGRYANLFCRAVLAFGIVGTLAAARAAPDAELPTQQLDEEITVFGSKPVPEEVRRELVQFVRKMGVATGDTPVARWLDPVCMRVIGLSPEHAGRVETKLKDVAAANGVPTAKNKSCQPNLIVTFAADGGDLVRRIASKGPSRLAEVPPTDRAALKNGLAPVRWWYTTEVRSRDGMPANTVAPPWTGGNSEGGGSVLPMNSNTTSLQQYSSSIVSTQAIRALTSATVVVDVNQAEGVTLDALAAYIALAGFAEIKATVPPPEGSILTLFEQDTDVRNLTQRDSVFLTALYNLALDRRARQQRGHLVRALVSAETSKP